ncbi:NADH:flavin oxidoreductase/NADH oxidase [Aspergillus costaricaensis CBS 115574]|uniref:NADH:flavin oxidoreductase/NADH oxidase n=1 Tax=Aspergillus costaricaensis CBS 115574 TaxID=1448317 RepID=A0ACD1I2I9_9EURO|nr:NADH:flavin oxidoreductase/NADH oxidase [Aspergillus costaricaensis CBS 115574]RAK84722.1 NADH:flavin oxidoreductase/NADH oxidase [Aspergillus costaricaensis CBS 115574]
MTVTDLFRPLTFRRGPALKNRILLAPLTNWQSNESDGSVTEADTHWLTRCAAGGFSMVMTCAANVHVDGKAFPGQMGIYSDEHLPGLRRIADIIRKHGGVSSVQIHHGGARISPTLIGGQKPVGPSAIIPGAVRGLSLAEVEQARDDFIAAAVRAQRAGFDGVEVHGAFGWLIMQFLSPIFNRRTDHYGGSLENRARFLFEIIDGIRRTCRPDFQIGLRISMERYGVPLIEMREVAARALREARIDYLDLAVWDYRKMATEEPFLSQTMLSVFTDLPRPEGVRVGASGHVMTARQAAEVLDAGCDFVMIGKAAILDPELPKNVEKNEEYVAPKLPVTAEYLRSSGLSERFVDYMRTWEGFVLDA